MECARVLRDLGIAGTDRTRHISRPRRALRELPGRAQNSACVLVPDARAMPRGFHDVTLVDMTSGYNRCDRSDSLDGRDAQLAMTVAHISVDGDDTTTDRPGVNEAGVQEPVSRSSSREMHILWTKHYA